MFTCAYTHSYTHMPLGILTQLRTKVKQLLFILIDSLCYHTYIFTPQCNPAGRSAADSEKVLIVQDVKQIGEDPLIVFDGI